MSIALNDSRQAPLWAYVDFVLADVASAQDAFELPAGAIVVDGFVAVSESFNAGTTATLKIGDSVDDDRYTATPVDAKTVGTTRLTATGYEVPATGKVKFTFAQTGTAATTGKARVGIAYIRAGRTQSTQG